MPKWTFLVVVTGIICSESHAFQPGAVHLAPGSPWPRCQLKSTVSAPSATVVAAQGHPQSDESRSKISVANKGKTPWNKGGKHSPETRAKIAATSARNARKKLEAKAAAMGMTLDEWNASIEEERQKRKSEPRTVSDETRAKISLALKARWNNPEYREANKNKVRANLNNTGGVRSHSPETRKRISESLKKKWAEDPEYREKVMNTAISVETRKKISASLRERWRDPEFRATMTERVRGNMPDEHRRKISEAIKQKWLDPVYRQSAMSSNRNVARAPHSLESRQRLSEAAKARWAAQSGARAEKKAKLSSSKAREAEAGISSKRAAAASEKSAAAGVSSSSASSAPSGDVKREVAPPSMLKEGSDELSAAAKPLGVAKKVPSAPAGKPKLKAAAKPRSSIVERSGTARPVPSMSNEGIKPTTTGYNNVIRAQNEADKVAAASVSEDDAEAARIARLKVEHFDLWSALYAEDEEIIDRPVPVKKAQPAAMSARRR